MHTLYRRGTSSAKARAQVSDKPPCTHRRDRSASPLLPSPRWVLQWDNIPSRRLLGLSTFQYMFSVLLRAQLLLLLSHLFVWGWVLGYHSAALAGLELAVYPKLVLNLWQSSCLCLLSTGMTALTATPSSFLPPHSPLLIPPAKFPPTVALFII